MKIDKILFLIFVILLGIFLVNSIPQKINKEVYDNLENNPREVRVIIELKEPALEKGFIFKTQKTEEEIVLENKQTKNDLIKSIGEQKIKHIFDKSVAMEISQTDLTKLEKNSNIKSVIIDRPVSAFLQDSVPLINASTVWPIQLSGFNITGIDETICIIDTGTNFTHQDLIGKNKTCVIDCQVFPASSGCIENCSISDDNGHGTHVAGIVAANGGINGVGINTKLIAVKALDSTGSGYTSDVNAGIDWCTTNSALYNISVISMSLGTSQQYNDYCDGVDSSTDDAINTAVGNNISVIVATGNKNSTQNIFDGIASPACVRNSTRVSATNKSDTPASYAFRNSNFTDILFAPGSDINSTMVLNPGGIILSTCGTGKSYCSLSGTSMSTPHVAGAFAIIRQFFRLQNNRIPTPSEIKILLNNTGKLIDDSAGSGLNFTRIDIYSALISIDSSAPTINLTYPLDNAFNFSQNITFRCSANDVLLSNITFYLWNSTELYNTTFSDVNRVSAQAEFNLTNLPSDIYEWNCLAYDHNNNFSFASSNYTLIINSINTILNSPTNNTFTNKQTQNFNCSAETISSQELSNITFYLWNSIELIYNITQNLTGTTNSTIFNYNLTNQTSYQWNCKSYNNESNFTFSRNNYTLTYDITKPNVTSVSPFPENATSSSISRIFYYNTTDNYNINNCSLIINNAISLTNSSINSSLTNNFTQTFSPETYNWKINCTDIAGNTENSSTQSFTITAPVVVTSSGGGGGGGGSSIKTYTAFPEQTSTGYTKSLSKNDKIKFTISNEITEQHTITTNYVGKDYADLTIQSDPINFILYVGEDKKLNLTSLEYYNLYVKLNSIKNQKANLTIQTIHESIIQVPIEIQENKTITGESVGEEEIEQPKIPKIENFKTLVIIILIIVVLVISIIKHKRKKKNESTKTKRKGK